MKTGKNPAPGFKKYPGHHITTKPAQARVRVTFQGELIADTTDAIALEEAMGAGKKTLRPSSITFRART